MLSGDNDHWVFPGTFACLSPISVQRNLTNDKKYSNLCFKSILLSKSRRNFIRDQVIKFVFKRHFYIFHKIYYIHIHIIWRQCAKLNLEIRVDREDSAHFSHLHSLLGWMKFLCCSSFDVIWRFVFNFCLNPHLFVNIRQEGPAFLTLKSRGENLSLSFCLGKELRCRIKISIRRTVDIDFYQWNCYLIQ